MLALTYMSKSQYRDIKKAGESQTINQMHEKYGVCLCLKLQQFLIVDIIESAWVSYKKTEGHTPKDSDEFYHWIVEDVYNVNGQGPKTIWSYGLEIVNKKMDEVREKHPDYSIYHIDDTDYTRAVLYTHIKAKIGDWTD